MPALKIRDDISSEELRRQARRKNDGRVSARLIAIANALDGMDRVSAVRLAGMDRQTLRDWVHRYNAEGIAGLCDRPKPGRIPKLSEGQMASCLAPPDRRRCAERLWLHLRDNRLSHRVFRTTDEIIDSCCDAWNWLLAETGRIRSLCSYPWFQRVAN